MSIAFFDDAFKMNIRSSKENDGIREVISEVMNPK